MDWTKLLAGFSLVFGNKLMPFLRGSCLRFLRRFGQRKKSIIFKPPIMLGSFLRFWFEIKILTFSGQDLVNNHYNGCEFVKRYFFAKPTKQ